MDYRALSAQLLVDEGYRRKPYRDTTGHLTIGIGRNLDGKGITRAEAEYLLANDITEAEDELNRHAPWWQMMPEPARRGLLNMCFNMGWPVLSEFEVTLGHLKAGRYEEAARTCLQSLWAKQVGARADRVAALFDQAAA